MRSSKPKSSWPFTMRIGRFVLVNVHEVADGRAFLYRVDGTPPRSRFGIRDLDGLAPIFSVNLSANRRAMKSMSPPPLLER
jgi:hypothetical protein